jgi:hypothetical protein
MIAFHASGNAGIGYSLNFALVVRQAVFCATGMAGMLDTLCANGKADNACYALR